MSTKLLTVVGATGTQGHSLINAVLKDGSYQIRAITRNATSSKAQDLHSKGVEVVQADINDEQSLVQAFKGSSAIFGVTDFFEPFSVYGPEKAIEIEAAQGINLAKAASKTPSLEHYIWSTLPNGEKLTAGEYKIPHFVSKNLVDDFIKQNIALFAKTTFLWITFYGNNIQYPIFTPNFLKSSGVYIQLSPAASTTPVKTIGSPLSNIGRFTLAILKQPQKTLPGKFVVASVEETTTGAMLEDWTTITGNRAVYVQTSLDDFSNVWPKWGFEMGAMMEMWDKLNERSWTGEGAILTREDLGLSGEDFVGYKGALGEMNLAELM